MDFISDLNLLMKLPHLMKGRCLDDMISKMLDEEGIKSSQPPKVSMKNGVVCIPSTINTDWTQTANGTSFLEPTQNEGGTSSHEMEYNARSLSTEESIRSVKRRKSKVETELASDISPKRSYTEDLVETCQTNSTISSGDKTTLDRSSHSNEVRITSEPKSSPERNLQTTASRSPAAYRPLEYENSLAKDELPYRPLLDKLQWVATEKSKLDAATMEQIINTLVMAQAKYCYETPRPGTKEWTYLRKQQAFAREKRDSSIVRPSREESLIIIGGRYVRAFEIIIKQCVQFAKHIPGFKDLHADDQISLIKESRQTTHFPSTVRSINKGLRVFTPVPDVHIFFDDFSALDSDRIVKYLLEVSGKSIWQTATVEVNAIIKSIILTDPDRCEKLQDREKVYQMHRDLVACLRYHVEKTAMDMPRGIKEIDYMLLACKQFSTKFRAFFKEKLIKLPVHGQNQYVTEIL